MLRPISGGKNYVAAGVLNCINRNFMSDLQKTVDEHIQVKFLPEFGLDFLLDIYTVTYTQIIENEIERLHRKEVKLLEHYNDEAKTGPFYEFATNKNKLARLGDQANFVKQCIPVLRSMYAEDLENFLEKNEHTHSITLPLHEYALNIADKKCIKLFAKYKEQFGGQEK